MAIQVRRGNERDFDPNKLLPGEWAVFLDTQKVWMCFAPGIVKRLGTYEDFYAQIAEATEDIRNSYVSDFDEIKADIELMADAVSSDKEEVLIIKSDIVNTYLPQIKAYVERAETAFLNAEASANNSSNSATLSESYAVGGTGTREGENADNAKYYYEQAKHISQGGNGLVPMGTIAFEDIPITDIVTNAMYNISNDFISDERFVDGGGVLYGKGSNIFYTVDGLWDVLAASDVKGVKGAAEDTYRQGNVNITAENVGAVAVDGDTADNTVAFTSNDSSAPTEWTDVAVLSSGEKHSSILNKISTMLKNVRYLYKMLGTTDISSISDGTISGILAFLKSGLDDTNSNKLDKDLIQLTGVSILEVESGGNYYIASPSDPVEGENGGYLKVISTSKNYNYRTIEWTPNTKSYKYMNTCASGKWSGWERVALNSNLNGFKIYADTPIVTIGENGKVTIDLSQLGAKVGYVSANLLGSDLIVVTQASFNNNILTCYLRRVDTGAYASQGTAYLAYMLFYK